MYEQTTKTNFLQPKPLTEFEKRMIAYCDSNHDLCAAMVRELERLNKNLELEARRPTPDRPTSPPST